MKLSKLDIGRLTALKKVMRETSHTVKPMRSVDRKKENSRKACRKTVAFFKYS